MMNTATFSGQFIGLGVIRNQDGSVRLNADGSMTVYVKVNGKVGAAKDPATGQIKGLYATNSFKAYIGAGKIKMTPQGLDIGFLGTLCPGQPVSVAYTPRNDRFTDKSGNVRYEAYLRLESIDVLEDYDTAQACNPIRVKIRQNRQANMLNMNIAKDR